MGAARLVRLGAQAHGEARLRTTRRVPAQRLAVAIVGCIASKWMTERWAAPAGPSSVRRRRAASARRDLVPAIRDGAVRRRHQAAAHSRLGGVLYGALVITCPSRKMASPSGG